MKAAVLREQPGRLAIEELAVDGPRRDEVLVEVKAAGLCHTDLHYMQGKFPTRLPAVMGHEAAGVVEAVGDDVQGIRPGDHVVCCISAFCGSCATCLSGRPFLCRSTKALVRQRDEASRLLDAEGQPVQQYAALGAFAEQMLVHAHNLVVIDPAMPLDRAAVLGCGVLTGTGAVFRTAEVERGSRVAVIGAGGSGLSAIQAARIAGARQVVAVDVTAERLDLARLVGATDAVNAAEVDDVVEAVRELTGGGVDHAFEVVGTARTAEQAFHMLDLGGVATIVGMIPEDQPLSIRALDLIRRQKRLQGSLMGSNRFRVDIPNLVQLYLSGSLLLDEVISTRIPFVEIDEGYAALERGEVTRAVACF